MRHRVLILACGLATAGVGVTFGAAPADANVLIRIDKSTQQMTVMVDGALRWQWAVSTGRPGRDTPSGTFRAFRMDAQHFSKEFNNAPMPYSIFFTKSGDAVHGFFDIPHLGLPVSHGCVRLDPANAAKLFAVVQQEGVLNTTVEITGNAMVALARHRALAAAQPSAQPVALTPPAYGSSYGASYGSADDRSSYGDRDDGYRDQRAYSPYRDDRGQSVSTDERYAPLVRAPADGPPTPPPNYPAFPQPWR
jgi:hypothetical protein